MSRREKEVLDLSHKYCFQENKNSGIHETQHVARSENGIDELHGRPPDPCSTPPLKHVSNRYETISILVSRIDIWKDRMQTNLLYGSMRTVELCKNKLVSSKGEPCTTNYNQSDNVVQEDTENNCLFQQSWWTVCILVSIQY